MANIRLAHIKCNRSRVLLKEESLWSSLNNVDSHWLFTGTDEQLTELRKIFPYRYVTCGIDNCINPNHAYEIG